MLGALEVLAKVWVAGFTVTDLALNWRAVVRAMEDLEAAKRGERPPRPTTYLADLRRAALWPFYLWRPW